VKHPGRSRVGRGRGPAYRLIVFGHLTRNRRLASILEALASYPRRDRFHLDIYGTIREAGEVQGQLGALNLRGQVTVHGWVPEATLEAALTAADLALNLRYPTMGEASASQLRIWDHALPSLVTPVGWYASIPEGAVGRVRVANEIADLHMHLDAFLADPEGYSQKGAAGRRILEERHSPAAYVRALLDLAENAQSHGARAADYLLLRAAAELQTWANPKQPALAFPRVAQEVQALLFD
jgi:glycosyltransferase involved in cell wall biosynthesis